MILGSLRLGSGSQSAAVSFLGNDPSAKTTATEEFTAAQITDSIKTYRDLNNVK